MNDREKRMRERAREEAEELTRERAREEAEERAIRKREREMAQLEREMEVEMQEFEGAKQRTEHRIEQEWRDEQFGQAPERPPRWTDDS